MLSLVGGGSKQLARMSMGAAETRSAITCDKGIDPSEKLFTGDLFLPGTSCRFFANIFRQGLADVSTHHQMRFCIA